MNVFWLDKASTDSEPASATAILYLTISLMSAGVTGPSSMLWAPCVYTSWETEVWNNCLTTLLRVLYSVSVLELQCFQLPGVIVSSAF